MPYKDKEIRNARSRERYAENREQLCENRRKYYEKNRERVREYSQKWCVENRDKQRAYSRKWQTENRDKQRASVNKWYNKNKEMVRGYSQNYYLENKERLNSGGKEWKKANPSKVRTYMGNRRAAELNATPAWLTDKQKEKTAKIYAKAVAIEKRTGVKHHVDHIVPLQGENVCGLHVPWNLQVLTATENISKGNRIK